MVKYGPDRNINMGLSVVLEFLTGFWSIEEWPLN